MAADSGELTRFSALFERLTTASPNLFENEYDRPQFQWGTHPTGLEQYEQSVQRWTDEVLQGRANESAFVTRTVNKATPTYVDASRRVVLEAIVPALTLLDSDALTGQRNCWILLGTRGVGKTRFLKAVVHAMWGTARATTCTIYVNFRTMGVTRITAMIFRCLREKFPHIPELPEGREWEHITAVLQHQNLNVAVIIDELEALYRQDDTLSNATLRDLHVVGEMDTSRRVVVLATGSAAVLRRLVFSLPAPDTVKEAYPLHRKQGSLNDRKYTALQLDPVQSSADFAFAFLCIASGAKWAEQAVRDGLIVCETAPEVRPSSGGRDFVNAGGRVPEAVCERWLPATRGLPSWFDLPFTSPERSPFINRLFGNLEHRTTMSLLYQAWLISVKKSGKDPTEAGLQSQSVKDFWVRPSEIFHNGNAFAQAYQMADEGVIAMSDLSQEPQIKFLHPADVLHSMLQFARNRADVDSSELTDAEKLSVLRPQLASADEINEVLVMESISLKSKESTGITIAGHLIKNLDYSSEHFLVADVDTGQQINMTAVAKERIHCLGKEFPDMFGADAVCYTRSHVAELATSSGILLRVQVKFSADGSSTKVDSKTANAWLEKLVAHSKPMVDSLQAAGVHQPIVPLHVMWCGQPCSLPAADIMNRRADLYVNPSNMLGYWSSRVARFVRERKLERCGAESS